MTDTIVVKIESSYISLMQIKERDGILRLISLRRALFPEKTSCEMFSEDPELLAETIISGIRRSGMKTKNLAVYFGAGTERFAEYRFSSSLSDAEKQKRGKQEAQALIAGPGRPVYRVINYPYTGMEGELSASAVFAVDAKFCEKLVTSLEKEDFIVTVLSSTLLAFAGLAKLTADIGDRVLVISAEKKEFKAALFTDGKLARLLRSGGGAATGASADSLLPFITDQTKVVLCGFESQNKWLRDFLKKAGAAAVGSVNQKMKGPKARFSLSGELSYKGALFPGIFSAAALPLKPADPSYFPAGRKKSKPLGWIKAVCIVMLFVALFICALPPVTLFLAEREYVNNSARFEDPFYADAGEKLILYRLLVSENTELIEAEKKVPARDPSYTDIIDELRKGLLADAVLEEMFYERGNGLFLDFIVYDAEAFDRGKNQANQSGRMNMYEPNEREELSEGVWRIQLRVSRTLSPEGAG